MHLLPTHVVPPHATSLQMQSLCLERTRFFTLCLLFYVFLAGFGFKDSSKLLLVCWVLSVLPSSRGSHNYSRGMPAEGHEGGRQAEASFPLTDKKAQALCAANVPAIIFQVHYLLFHPSYSWKCLIIIRISKVRQQYKQPCCCLTFSLFKICSITWSLLVSWDDPLQPLAVRVVSEGQGVAAQPQKSLGNQYKCHGATMQDLKGYCTQSNAEFSNASVSLAIAWAAELQCWFMAESNLLSVMLLSLSFKGVSVQDACTGLPSFM